ncbi:penicillin-binding protein activator [Dongia soli]|uniref:Penicillin-binding protein activator n=1 Tax=Dongia soli TaxID=600628 RepID=A0ABU5E6G5_9PROT|nr:penicillin-binding protein activator [Dongia soli]MDY0881912.1 penicillin-binding protein activator [Dongia soli]
MSALGARVKRILAWLSPSSFGDGWTAVAQLNLIPRSSILSMAGLLLGGLVLAGCAGNTPAPAAKTAPQAVMTPTQPQLAPQPAPVAPGGKIGLMLPLSGQHANLGRALLQAAEMGLFDVGDDSFTLLVEDTATSNGPESAARKLLAGGANILLGPLFGTDVKRVAPIAQNAHVPLIAFTNDSSLAQNGVYVFGVTPESQVQRVIGYAGSQGLKRYAILTPNSPYGRLVLTSFQTQVKQIGGQVAQIDFYDPSSVDFAPVVQRLADEKRTVGFDALMIPEGGAKMRQIAPLLPAFEVGPQQLRLLGTSLWGEGAVWREAGLAGGWYATTAPDRWQDFANHYREVYGATPDQRAAIVYDAVTLAVALGKGPQGADYSPTALTNGNGFSGIAGVFRLMPNGTVDRGLAVMEVAPTGPVQRDPAPTSFVPVMN